MPMIIVTKWFGVFLVDKDKVVRSILFDKNPNTIAQKLSVVQRGEILTEEEQLAGKHIHVAEARMSSLGRPEFCDSSFIHPEDFGYSPQLMQKVMIELGKMRIREPLSPDRVIVQAVRALDDVIETINLVSERLHEWYGLYFPELSDYAADESYARMISEKESREDILDSLDLRLETVGSELEPVDLNSIRHFASSLHYLYEEKEELEKYIKDRMDEAAPNLSAVVGHSLAARLISLAGGLKRLTTMPAGTVQLLGAEKALFAHLKQGKRPPKHGIIFQHPLIHKAAYWQRGKIARAMSNKLSLAAKIDYFKGEFIGDQLYEDLCKRVEEIQEKYPEPPPRKEPVRQNRKPKKRNNNKNRKAK
ncbi:ribosomal biogenesis protein [Candidatus Methanomassiliicoccus intestinalis]|uniref:Ribosomal biogenesis protein n=2 Tax=Candidatus Methanomassiliicoccus intestinalis TaxID=1406512 RepID=A0A8J8PCU6_9ARCH|nr:MAG: ribosomal biogenesis protein [Candidatus Methanomassiliicoccus intestinalis]